MTRGAGGLRDQGRTPLARAAALLVGAAALGASGCAEDTALQLFPPSCTDDCAQGAGGSGTSGQAGTGGVAGAINSTSTGSQGGTHGCGALGSRVRTSQLSLEAPAVPSDEYNPVLLAPRPDSTSLLGYRRADALEISVLALDASDAVERELFSTAAEEAHALLAHEQGGALVVVREDPDIFHAQFCRGGAPSQPPCNALELMRFDDSGTLQMSATLTDKLSVDTEGALFIWWFEHTARMVFAEQTYGIYFRSARTVPQPDGLVPRPGDTLRFVGADGTRLDRGWDFGCIESWSVRLEYNGVWAAVCHGGVNPYAHRVVLLEGSEERELWIL